MRHPAKRNGSYSQYSAALSTVRFYGPSGVLLQNVGYSFQNQTQLFPGGDRHPGAAALALFGTGVLLAALARRRRKRQPPL